MAMLTVTFISVVFLPFIRGYETYTAARANNSLTRAKRGVLITEKYWEEGLPYRFEGLSEENIAYFTKDAFMLITKSGNSSSTMLELNRCAGTVPGFRHQHERSLSDFMKKEFRKAVKAWQDNTCVNFMEISHSPPKKASVRVQWHISKCASVVGKYGYSEQLMYLAPACEFGTIAHELGHALGLVHTHERPDRDKYMFVEVDPELNFDFSNFTKEEVETYNLGYDFGSIMQYSMINYGSWKDPSMMPLDGRYNYTLGSRSLSFNDFTMINNRYRCREICLKRPRVVKCENGGYEHPRNCSRCLCPSGFGGDSCNDRPNENNCGEVLNTTQSYQNYTFEFKNDRWDWLDGFKRCYWWIKAPKGTAIDIKVSSIVDYPYSPEGCPAAGIEIKANDDQTLTGYRICDKSQIGLVFESKHDLVPIITFTKMSDTSKYTIEYRHVDPKTRTTTTQVTAALTTTTTTSTTSTTTSTTTTTRTTRIPTTTARTPKKIVPSVKKKKGKKVLQRKKKNKSKKSRRRPKISKRKHHRH